MHNQMNIWLKRRVIKYILLYIHDVAKWPCTSVHLIDSHDLNNQTVSHTDVLMAEWSEHKTEDVRRAC